MTRYFFHLAGDPYERDEEGIELDDNAAAKRQGVMSAAQMMLDNPRALLNGSDINIEITDDRGLVLFLLNVCVTNAPAGAPPESAIKWV